ncbi:MAG: long-chain fatty acid--CoA ligase [Candidatus Melainabacteria bacterium]|nr:long-chain fatty acid--CoA ligase [Candidatus Melainabacteria bacterium]
MISRNLAELFINQSNKCKNKIAVEYRLRRHEPYRSITWQHLKTILYELTYGLIELGLRKGDKVAILSETRYEWAVCDLAILTCGGIVIPMYPTLGDEAVNYILNNSEAKIIILEDKGQLQKIRSQWEQLPRITYAVVIEDKGDIPQNDPRIINLKRLMDKGKLNFSKDPYLVDHHLKNVDKDNIATIIYTSGTTGQPKGVILTHKNILSVISVLPQVLPLKPTDKFLSFLPLSHVFERVGGLYYTISTGATISYCSSVDQIGAALKDSGATIMLVVPRLLEKIYSKVKMQLASITGFKKKLIDLAFSKNEKKNIFLCYLAKTIIFPAIRKSISPTLKYFVSGGAPLSIEVANFFHLIGFPVLEGYGLTETSAPATVNTLKDFKIGTVGKALPNVEIKIANDGEVLIKGPNVFCGYYKNEQITKEAFQDGWFCTGDIGIVDSDGFLKITDRKKDIIINSAGKNIAPQNIENSLKNSPYISNAVVIGDKRKYLCALITLDEQAVIDFAKKNNINYKKTNNLNVNSKIIHLIDEEIKLRTSNFSDYEQIRKFTILPNDFKIETGEITPTLKVKRKFVEEKYKRIIDAMYPGD